MNAAGIKDLVPQALRQQWAQEGHYPNRTLFAAFAEHAQARPDHPAVVTPSTQLSYQKLLEQSLRLAHAFQRLGVVPGDVVAHQMPNRWQSLAIELAAAALGAVLCALPPGRGHVDLGALLRRCGARVFVLGGEPIAHTRHAGPTEPSSPISADSLHAQVEAMRPTALHLRWLIMDDSDQPEPCQRPGWLSLQALLDTPPLDLNTSLGWQTNGQTNGQTSTHNPLPANEPARFLVSSGSEAQPKLVAYSHNALLGGRGRFLQSLHPEGHTMRALYLVPLGSAFGSTATAGVLCHLGGTVLLLPKFDPQQALEAMAQFKATHVLGVPTMFLRMAAHPSLGALPTPHLKALVCGGSSIDATTVKQCLQAFGCSFTALYGSADGVNCHTNYSPTNHSQANNPALADSSAPLPLGQPNPSICDLRIVDEHGQTLPQGQVGEVLARGPMTPMQYVNAPELDAQYRNPEGWVYTGDLGQFNAQGQLVLTGRKKDIVIRGGANIRTPQVEALVRSLPGVVDAVCMGMDDADLGQRLGLCLSMQAGHPLPSLHDIQQHLKTLGLEKHKWPEYLRLMRTLPITPAGKVDKAKLTQEARFVADPSAAMETKP